MQLGPRGMRVRSSIASETSFLNDQIKAVESRINFRMDKSRQNKILVKVKSTNESEHDDRARQIFGNSYEYDPLEILACRPFN